MAVAKKKISKKSPSKKVLKSANADSASSLIDQRIEDLGDWRAQKLAQIRALVLKAVPEVIEEWKWRGVPVWSYKGILFTGETYKEVVKMTFPKGAAMKDPSKLFNSSLEGNARRAIDWREKEKINEKALRALILEAVALNEAKPAGKPRASKKS